MALTTSKQVLSQVLEPLRRTAVMPHDAAILAFQLLAWADQTAKGHLSPADRIDTALQSGAAGITEPLERLAMAGGALGQAFNNAAVVARSASTHVVEAAAAAKRLVDAGVFERFFPADVAADLMPWVAGYEPLSRQVVQMLFDLTMADEGTSIYCPWEFSGQFIRATMWNTARVHAECSLPFPLPALVSLFRKAETTIQVTEPVREPLAVKAGRLEKFEATIAFPPIGLKFEPDVVSRDIYDRFVVPKATATGLMIQHIVAQTHGLAAIVVPNSFLFGPGTDKEVREHLLRTRQVQAVIALPPGILQNSNIPIAILLLNTAHPSNVVRFIDATQPFFSKALPKGRSELTSELEISYYCHLAGPLLHSEPLYQHENSRLDEIDSSMAVYLSPDEVLDNEASLQVDRYVMPPERRQLQALLEAAQSAELGELVEFVSPLPNKDRGGGIEGLHVFEVGAVDLPPVGYIRAPSKSVSIRLTKRARSGDSTEVFLRPFDIVLIIKGSVGKIGVVPEYAPPAGEGGWIAGQSATVLRSKDGRTDLRPLALMLRSKIGQELLASIQSGASIQMISLSSLRRLAVPALPEDLAHSAILVLDREAQLQEQISDLQREQSELADSLWDTLLTDAEHS